MDFDEKQTSYYRLMEAVWPPKDYPKAYRNSCNGGPPGVAMVFGTYLHKMRQEGLISRRKPYLGHHFGQEDVALTEMGKAVHLPDDL